MVPIGYEHVLITNNLVGGEGAGFGNLEIVVNGGRVTSHVHTISKEQYRHFWHFFFHERLQLKVFFFRLSSYKERQKR